MRYSTTVGVDLAKNLIQVSVVSPRGKELLDRSFTRVKLAEFLGKQQPSLVAFESCASTHYWARAAKRHGHEARITPAKAVVPFRQGHKKVGNRRLRSILIQGARAYVYRMKEPRSLKDRWLKDLIERAGPNRAAVALANKNVRTARAMVTQGTEYPRRLQLEMAA